DLVGSVIAQRYQITAVIGSEFGIAHMVKKAALRLGRRVPEDLAVCCFDEKYGYLGEFEFTHIRQDEAALARKALDVLYAMLDGKNMRRQRFVIPTHLHEGSTT
ncbi:MAG TPA: substrate-binding domain-containing protein, partial [Clostridia bacterium]|nr:substrate-binding domain-containing protein [Clostridia bacterium]